MNTLVLKGEKWVQEECPTPNEQRPQEGQGPVLCLVSPLSLGEMGAGGRQRWAHRLGHGFISTATLWMGAGGDQTEGCRLGLSGERLLWHGRGQAGNRGCWRLSSYKEFPATNTQWGALALTPLGCPGGRGRKNVTLTLQLLVRPE